MRTVLLVIEMVKLGMNGSPSVIVILILIHFPSGKIRKFVALL